VYRAYSLFAVAKTTEVFSNGIIVFYFRLRQLDPSRANADGVFTPAPHSFGGRGPSESGDGFSLDGAGRGSPLMKAGVGRGSAGHLPSIASGGNLAGGGGVPGAGGAAGAAAMARNPSATAFTFDRETAAMEALRDRRSVYAAGGPNAPSLGERMRDLVRDVALHFVLPRTSLTPLLSQGLLSAQEVRVSSRRAAGGRGGIGRQAPSKGGGRMYSLRYFPPTVFAPPPHSLTSPQIAYAYCAWKFTFTFVSRMTAEFNALNKILRSPALAGDSSSEAMSLLSKLRKQVQSHSYTETQILDCIYRYPDVVVRACGGGGGCLGRERLTHALLHCCVRGRGVSRPLDFRSHISAPSFLHRRRCCTTSSRRASSRLTAATRRRRWRRPRASPAARRPPPSP
jgi:hypothetical protein